MSKLRIKNFGPIKEGLLENDGWIEFRKVTVLIGNQGSGKSTVAKLFSTFSWIEKAIVMGTITIGELSKHNRFLKQLEYLKIDKFVSDLTAIEYIGKAFSMSYIEGKFEAEKSPENGYFLPKIMYIPAERNLLSSVDRPDKLKNLPIAVYTFNDEFDKAKNTFAGGFELPINNAKFEYDKLNKLAWIVGEHKSYKLRLSEVSSGFQSSIPLLLVTKYLSEHLTFQEDLGIKENSLEEQKKLAKEIKAILDDPLLTSEIRQLYLQEVSAKRKRTCIVNIVEEPEQNLYPDSQTKILFELLKYNNMIEQNQLILTSHSPYIINDLTLVVKADMVKKKVSDEVSLQKLAKIVPLESCLAAEDLAIYELDEKDGTIKLLDKYKGLPSDDNFLNRSLEDSNEQFAQLLEIEKGWL